MLCQSRCGQYIRGYINTAPVILIQNDRVLRKEEKGKKMATVSIAQRRKLMKAMTKMTKKKNKHNGLFLHMGLQTLARLAVTEGHVNPAEVYRKHKAFSGEHAMPLKDFDSSLNLSHVINPKPEDDVLEVNMVVTEMPIACAVCDAIAIANNIMNGENVKQLACVCGDPKFTESCKDYNSSICVVSNCDEEKKKVKVAPLLISGASISVVLGNIMQGFNEIKSNREKFHLNIRASALFDDDVPQPSKYVMDSLPLPDSMVMYTKAGLDRHSSETEFFHHKPAKMITRIG